MSNLQQVVALLGIRRVVRTQLEMRPLVRRGLPYRAMERVAKELDLSVDETAKAIGLAGRTMARRKAAKILDASESERVVRLARALTRAADVLGSREKARAWIRKPNRALHGEQPLALLDTDIGTQAVDDVLTRIEHGVFS